MNQLFDKLQKLKLTGFSKAYKEQIDQKVYESMSFDDRLSILIDREETERENRSIQIRVSKAKFKNPSTVDKIILSSDRGLDKTTHQTLIKYDWIRKKKNLIITASSGCGKTFLANTISHNACLLGFTARYYRSNQLFTDLEIAHEENKLHKILFQIAKFDILIIDDFLLSAMTESQQKYLFELIDERHESASTIFTSQNPVGLWHGLMPNPAISDAILDRITHSALRIELKGESMRKKKTASLDVNEEVQA